MTAIPSVMVPDPFQASVTERVYSHKVAQPPIRSEWRLIPVQGSFNTTQSVFNIFPPSNTTIVDRRLLLRIGVTVTNTSTGTVSVSSAAQTKKSYPTTAVPRAFPVNSIINQTNVVINGAGGFVTQTSDVLYPMKRFIGDNECEFYHSPTQLDAAPDFITQVGAPSAERIGSIFYGTNTSQAALPEDTKQMLVDAEGRIGTFRPRGTFPFTETTPGTSTARNVGYIFTEVILNGVLGHASEEVGLVNVSKLDVTILYETDAVKSLLSSWVENTGDNAFTAAMTSADLLVHYITPSIPSIPSVFTTDFKQYVINEKPAPGMRVSAQGVITSNTTQVFNNLTLNTVPEFMYIFIRPAKPLSVTTGEYTARVKSISINLGTSFGHLSQMDEFTLFLLAKDNGFKGNYDQWTRMGSILCIDCAKDLGLVPGQNRYLPIDFTIDAALPEGAVTTGVSYNIVLMAIVPGSVSIEPDRCTSILGFSSVEQANAMSDDAITETSLVKEPANGSGMGGHGGKFSWGGVWRAIKTGVRKAAPVAQMLAATTGNPYAVMASRGLDTANSLIGQGVSRKRGRGMLLG